MNEVGSHWVLFLLYLNIVPSWPEDGRSRPKLVAKYNLIVMCRLSWNLGVSSSWNPQGLSRPVMGLLYLYPENLSPITTAPQNGSSSALNNMNALMYVVYWRYTIYYTNIYTRFVWITARRTGISASVKFTETVCLIWFILHQNALVLGTCGGLFYSDINTAGSWC